MQPPPRQTRRLQRCLVVLPGPRLAPRTRHVPSQHALAADKQQRQGTGGMLRTACSCLALRTLGRHSTLQREAVPMHMPRPCHPPLYRRLHWQGLLHLPAPSSRCTGLLRQGRDPLRSKEARQCTQLVAAHHHLHHHASHPSCARYCCRLRELHPAAHPRCCCSCVERMATGSWLVSAAWGMTVGSQCLQTCPPACLCWRSSGPGVAAPAGRRQAARQALAWQRQHQSLRRCRRQCWRPVASVSPGLGGRRRRRRRGRARHGAARRRGALWLPGRRQPRLQPVHLAPRRHKSWHLWRAGGDRGHTACMCHPRHGRMTWRGRSWGKLVSVWHCQTAARW